MSVQISHAALQAAINKMNMAQKEMVEGLTWMEKNFVRLRDTLNGETRVSWEEFQAELKTLKINLNNQYETATQTLQKMHARQSEGDNSGSRVVRNAQGS
ncbi:MULTISPECIES: hypothetical protein [Streptomyces]|uniref:hypothetical protein n=1 Tax=Streptomyces TaxID=1883 RepID=UPI0004BD3B8F|nr:MULTISPECIES: hypothetical protein [unclassified Streptomyces]